MYKKIKSLNFKNNNYFLFLFGIFLGVGIYNFNILDLQKVEAAINIGNTICTFRSGSISIICNYETGSGGLELCPEGSVLKGLSVNSEKVSTLYSTGHTYLGLNCVALNSVPAVYVK